MELIAHQDLVGSTPVIGLTGTVDLGSIPLLHNRLRALIEAHPGATVAVDLDGVISLDDSGLGIILGAAGFARERNGDLVVVSTSPRLQERLRLTGLDQAVEVRDRI